METVSTDSFSFPNDPVQYEVIRWSALTDLLFRLAQQIHSSGVEVDRIVSVAKGGWPMARTLADFLQIREGSSIGTKLYTGINQVSDTVQIYQDLHDVTGERLLLIDDVADTGKTLAHVVQHLEKRKAASLVTATVYFKPHSVFKPDFFSKETTSWIIFPYEIIETAQLLHRKWHDQGVSAPDICARLTQIGCKREWQVFLGIDQEY